ncbi:hypothetical protein FFLO_02600 [Filobasidium floriforme]|uniref:Uncharacterized protein n=1 Tax=Filobasidium floriforme TaxID=5210 RepID=A0A8K0JMA5_9TREE|nr:uncharacterized protein HD553DRAFT_334491 [Filobasidium floriforme]KAG7561960.1 hypothetical protein FFLO_02600 [Filobasidium floriforme]KAH8087459.1 hypothetical protein HD553DRAFT_334491 [Filobasidium floriforme]
MTSFEALAKRMGSAGNSELLIVSFDIGTTQSGAALAYIAPEGKGSIAPVVIEKLPAKGGSLEPARTSANQNDADCIEVPPFRGKCLDKWGSQVGKLTKEEKEDLKSGKIVKVEWFKLHIDPEQNNNATHLTEPTKRLPKGKKGVDVWGEYLGRLSSAAKEAIKTDYHITWLEELEKRGKVRYVVTIPVAWQKGKLILIAKLCNDHDGAQETSCACRAYQARYDVKLEVLFGERGLRVTLLRAIGHLRPKDAGGGTVDFTSYRINQTDPIRLEEVGLASKVCLYSGSTYIDKSFRRVIKDHLQSSYPKTQAVSEMHIDKAVQMFSYEAKPDFTMKDVLPGCWKISENEDDFEDGEITVPWYSQQLRDRRVMALAFDEHVDKIVQSAGHIVADEKPKYIFCSGGLGDSVYLREKLEMHCSNVKIAQPDKQGSSTGSRAVTLGACIAGLRNCVEKRNVSVCIGCTTERRVQPWETVPMGETTRRQHGWTYLTNRFTVIINPNINVGEKEHYEKTLCQEFPHPLKGPGRCTLKILQTHSKIVPVRSTDPVLSEIGQFSFSIPVHATHRIQLAPDGTSIAQYTFKVKVFYGDTELRAAAYTLEDEVLGGNTFLEGPAKIQK